MPFPFDMSQVFWGLMNKTMWDCRFGNMNNGFSGFNGGFMNSCWGGGFQMPMWGDSCSFSSTGGSSSLTAEERVEKRKAEEKYTALKGVIQDYIKTLTSTADKDLKMLLEEKLKDCGSSYSVANYEKLTELYEEYKDKIQKKLKSDEGIEPSDKSKAAAKEFTNANIDFKKILATEGEAATTKAELAKDVDAMEFLYSLQTNKTKKKTFKQVYTDALKGANTTKTTELKKVLEAVYNGLSKEALEVKKEDGISEETKASLGKLLEISAESATADNVEQLYYWIRMAKAEVADSKYACLQEEFPEFKQANGVESTTAALKAEGLEPEKIKTQTVVTNYSDMENDTARMQSLESGNYVKALTKDQLKELNNNADVKKLGIKKAWVDTSSIHNHQVIRFIDKDGNMHALNGIVMKGGKIELTGDEIKAIASISPEQIQQRAATIASITSATDTLTEIQAKPDGTRVFQEKIITGDRDYKRLFVIDSDGNLKEWTNTKLNGKNFDAITSAKQELADITLDGIKNDINDMPTIDSLTAEGGALKATGVKDIKGYDIYIENASLPPNEHPRVFVLKDGELCECTNVYYDESSKELRMLGTAQNSSDWAYQPVNASTIKHSLLKDRYSSISIKDAQSTGKTMQDLLDGYTSNNDWDKFDNEMKNVTKYNVMSVLRGYYTAADSGEKFFEQLFKEATGRSRRQKIAETMKNNIIAYINDNIGSITDEAKRTEIETIKNELANYDYSKAHNAYAEEAKSLDSKIEKLFQLFNINYIV